jgi:PAS domain S-box-containing protein
MTESQVPPTIWHQKILEAIFNESADAIFLVNAETLLVLDCNPRAVELYEADSKQALLHIEGYRLQKQPLPPKERNNIIVELDRVGVWSQELEFVTLKGNEFWGNLAAKRINVVGKRLNLVRITDVTARRRAEEQIRISLQEKELLLKEVHHRVKNNLHIISNLLDLQSDQIQDAQLMEIFVDSQNRIQAMALIHEQLYQAKDFGRVEFGDYIHRLVNNLSFFYGDRVQSIHPVIEAEPIRINLETAISCGLLLNELVTNAFKHAFPDGRKGEVRIQLYQAAEQLQLKVCDNGIGIPPDLDWRNAKSLGLKLVQILAKQLRASLTFEPPTAIGGTCIQLSFTELKYRSRF